MYRRFKSHYSHKASCKSLIYDAFRKYGKENFSLEALYYGDNYNEMEKHFIRVYHTKAPNGYNIADGGDPPIFKGETDPSSKLKQIEVDDIQQMLLNGEKLEKIHKKYPHITRGQINRINNGEAWKKEILTYPLCYTKGVSPEDVLLIIEDLKKGELTLQEIGEKYGYCKSAIVNINQGKTELACSLWDKFPIKEKVCAKSRLKYSKEEVSNIEKILFDSSEDIFLKQIAKDLNISYTSILQINNREYPNCSRKYEYPIKKNPFAGKE